ncbi:MAG: GHKL domain-containing protein [Lachnospiraceae bacterium]|nr:GHKL domain-containing protein [Lachnospiraceae bacterium]
MMNYDVISELIINILRVQLIRKMMELFLPAEEADDKKIQSGFIFYYLMTTFLYSIFGWSVVCEIVNYLGILGLTFFYQGAWKKRVWISVVIFSINMACFLAVYFVSVQRVIVHQRAIQTLLLLICVTIISHTACPADSREIAFDKGQTYILIVIPAASVFILCMLLYGKSEGITALLICVSTLLINLSVFYLYHMMAENYRNLRENDIYRQQTYAYKNQLDVIMESQSRIRSLKHDMKNHMLTLQMLLRKKDWEEADRYLGSMQDFMANPAEYITTGNDAMDSLLNYKLQRANEILDTVEAKVSIPEKLILHSFDINVVLGNLLDNAIEAAVQTEEKKLKIAIKLDKGMLFINIRNSCQGIAGGKLRHLETTKEDAPNHGIGLNNVRRIVEKYHGDMDLICADGCMEVDIIMYIKEM